MNPFDKKTYIDGAIDNMRFLDVGESCRIDNFDKRTFRQVRSTIQHACNKLNFLVKVKTASDGEIWVKRIL